MKHIPISNFNDLLYHLKSLNLLQRQDSTTDQLRDLVEIANALGMYDAAKWLKDKTEKE